MSRLKGLALAVAMTVALAGCCAPAYKQPVNCGDTLFCDIQWILAVDEFSLNYMRNSAACLQAAGSGQDGCETAPGQGRPAPGPGTAAGSGQ